MISRTKVYAIIICPSTLVEVMPRTPCTFSRGNTDTVQVMIHGRHYHVGIRACFKMPSIRVLEKYAETGISRSVLGAKVEPDGWDINGSPSWLLVAGVI
jgi:hypothetical protein